MMNNYHSFNQAFKILKDKRVISDNSSFVCVDDGIVHHVYMINSNDDIYFLKIRLNYFSSNKNIKINPSDILFEKESIFIVQRYFDDFVPDVVFYMNNFLLLRSIKYNNSESVYKILFNQRLSTKDAENIGVQMKTFHKKISSFNGLVRSPKKEDEAYNNYLYWRFGIWNNENLNSIVTELKQNYNRQFIYGDFNPKNMLISDGHFSIFDLETFHKGNILFDVGFFAGHILLNYLNNSTKRTELAKSFLNAYAMNGDDLQMAIKLSLATLYYRIKSEHLYAVNFIYNKKNTISKIDDVLSHNNIDFSDLQYL